jgi:hypothetical protein
MTAYKARILGKTPKTGNKKDGATGRRRRGNGDKWTVAGFTWPGPQRSVYNYTWPGNFPVFRVGPGLHEDKAGLVARCLAADRVVFFEYGTDPVKIKRRLDDEILEIVRYEAELNNLPLAEIFDEIDFDASASWVTAPQAAARQQTPACQELAKRHNIGLDVADEIMRAR